MQTEGEEISSTMMMDPWSIILYGMKAPMIREKYRGRLAKFFDFIGLIEGTMEELAKTFTEMGRRQPDGVFVRVAKGEISPATLRIRWFVRAGLRRLHQLSDNTFSLHHI
jgi:hypothetical protein